MKAYIPDLNNNSNEYSERVRRAVGCGAKLAPGQWWNLCGETDMGQTSPVLCEKCNPEDGLKLAPINRT